MDSTPETRNIWRPENWKPERIAHAAADALGVKEMILEITFLLAVAALYLLLAEGPL